MISVSSASSNLQQWLSEGPFTLALSSSFFGFYSHCGVATALFERGYMPQKITGTSAGALVGGALASGMSPEYLRDVIFSKKIEDYWDPKIGLGFLAGKKFLKILEDHFSPTFENAQIPLEVGVLEIKTMKTLFLNSGPLPLAVHASCAVPGMFHPVRINGKLYTDGGVFNKSGINYDNSDERILNVFLESNGLTGIYERKTNFSKLKKTHRVIRFAQTPNVSFKALEQGRIAYEELYQRTKKIFESHFDETGIISA